MESQKQPNGSTKILYWLLGFGATLAALALASFITALNTRLNTLESKLNDVDVKLATEVAVAHQVESLVTNIRSEQIVRITQIAENQTKLLIIESSIKSLDDRYNTLIETVRTHTQKLESLPSRSERRNK